MPTHETGDAPSEGSCRTADGLELHLCSWEAPEPWCRLALIHGLGEHAGRYSDWAARFVAAGVSVHGVDLRGHGRSPGRRGGAAGIHEYVEDARALVDWMGDGAPIVFYGHSLGGLVVLECLVASDWQGVAGAIIASPWLALAFSPTPAKAWMGRALSCLFPRMVVHNGLRSSDLGRPKQLAQEYRDDPLVHPHVSLGVFVSAMRAGARWCGHGAEAGLPLLLMHGDADRITDWHATQACASHAGGLASLKLWQGGFHELHHDTVAPEVADYVRVWLRATCAAGNLP